MENKHFEIIRSALELCQGTVMTSIYFAIKNSETDLRMSAISCLVFLLSLEIQKTLQEKEDTFLGTVLDNIVILKPEYTDNSSEKDGLGTSKLKKNVKTDFSISNKSEEDVFTTDKEILKQKQKIGGELCAVLLHLFTAYNYAKSKKNSKQAEDKDLVIDALTNLLCISEEAKKTALQNNFPETALMALKELYVKLNSQPYELYKKQMEKKVLRIILFFLLFLFFPSLLYKSYKKNQRHAMSNIHRISTAICYAISRKINFLLYRTESFVVARCELHLYAFDELYVWECTR
jgi:hypothetical protein